MKWITLFLTIFLIQGHNVLAQENPVSAEISIYENDVEKELLTRYQDDPFHLLQSLYPNENMESASWDNLIKKLKKRNKKSKSANDKRFLEDIYLSTHQLMLNKYEEHAYFSKTLREGVYDCVTGTGLYALLLEEFDFKYQIIETDAHVYIKGQLGNKPFILESTYPINGLIIGKEDVQAFEQKVIGSIKSNPEKPLYLGKIDEINTTGGTFTIIGLRELAGLQYYNDAIKKFYEEDYTGTYTQLLKAEFLYPSERIVKLKQKMSFLLTSKSESKIH
ncbi:MAG: hypothetical protein EA341_13315 [Mongoliibacter sp.]|uniref:hypothetical protein n=1 Tax=Mongoliibacter sp. TaxID=2022438 RepID=UPI0012EF4C54|nr:hypothetical protein [Mongoliibacter sp.]TVP46840.1 MAG: hypothetical protein EA341_13315 [Mongoliibacter sp.]